MQRNRLVFLGSLLIATTILLSSCPNNGGGNPTPTKGTLVVDVTPNTVEWHIAGPAVNSLGINTSKKYIGNYTFSDVEPGSYTIIGSSAGFKTGSVTVSVVAGQTPGEKTKASLKLDTAQTGALVIDVTPDETLWTITGSVNENTGVNPSKKHSGDATLYDLEPGKYTISGSLEGYRPKAETILVEVGKKAILALTLKKKTTSKTGSLKVDITPNQVQWTITGPTDNNNGVDPTEKHIGDKTLTDLEPGNYKVKAELSGYVGQEATTTVEADKETELKITLVQQKLEKVVEVFFDKDGKPYPHEKEDNPSKNVNIWSIQKPPFGGSLTREEPFCFKPKVVAKNGNGIPGVRIEVSGTSSQNFFFLKGCSYRKQAALALQSTPSSQSGNTVNMITDNNGEAIFTIFVIFHKNDPASLPLTKVVFSAHQDEYNQNILHVAKIKWLNPTN